jgi:hypothetical protein
MQFNIKTLKICLAILCLLPVRAVGLPQFGGATFFMEAEIWKDIIGFEGRYQISNHGNVKSLSRTIIRKDGFISSVKDRILKFRVCKFGYNSVHFYLNEKEYSYKVHRLVAIAFLNKRKDSHQVNHKDGDKKNNYYSNLEWVSNRENVSHHKVKRKKSSKYLGVTKHRKKWLAQVYVNGKHISLGLHKTQEIASYAYNNFLKTHNINNKYSS